MFSIRNTVMYRWKVVGRVKIVVLTCHYVMYMWTYLVGIFGHFFFGQRDLSGNRLLETKRKKKTIKKFFQHNRTCHPEASPSKIHAS